MNKNTSWIAAAITAAVVVALGLYEGFEWTVNRVYVPEGKSLLLALQGPLALYVGQQVCESPAILPTTGKSA